MELYSILGQLGGIAALVIALFYLHNQNVNDRRAMDARLEENKRASDARWAALKSENDANCQKSDDRWAALKNETDTRSQKSDDRWAALKSETDERWVNLQQQWLEGQKEIVALMRRMNLPG